MTLTLATASAGLADRGSAATLLVQRALNAIAARERIPAGHQLRAAVEVAQALTRRLEQPRPESDPRVLVLAIRMVELAGVERVHAATIARQEQRSTQAQGAGRARAQLAVALPVAAIRTWCRAQGIEVPSRGRYLPDQAVSAWAAAHPDHPAVQAGANRRSTT